MTQLFSRIVRLAINVDQAYAPITTDGTVFAAFAGSPIRLQLAFYSAGVLVTDFSRISAIELQIKQQATAGGAPAQTDPYYASELTSNFNASLSESDWEAGNACHCEIDLSASDLELTPGSNWWLIVAGISSSPITYAAGPMTILGDGFGAGVAAPAPASPPWTQAESDARYLIKSGSAFANGNVILYWNGAAQDSGINGGTLAYFGGAWPNGGEVVVGVASSGPGTGTQKIKGSGVLLNTLMSKITGGAAGNVPTMNADGSLNPGFNFGVFATYSGGYPSNGELVAGSFGTPGAGTQSVRSTGVFVPSTNSTSTDNQMVLGSDLRLGRPGGVALVSGTSAFAGNVFPWIPHAPEHTMMTQFRAKALPTSGFAYVVFGWGPDLGTFGFAIFPDGSASLYNDSNNAILASWPAGSVVPGSWNSVLWTHAAGGYHQGILNGVAATSTGALGGYSFALSGCGRPPAVYGSGAGSFTGDVLRYAWWNVVLSPGELNVVQHGELPASLARRGYTYSNPVWTGAYNYALSAVTTSGYTVTYTGGFAFADGAGIALKAGQKVRVKFTLSLISGAASNLPAAALLNGAGFCDYTPGIFSPGLCTATLTAPADDIYRIIISNHPGVWGNGGNSSFTVSGLVIDVIGLLGSYSPDGVSYGGTWKDESGNCNDLVAVSGVTPRAPRPQTRDFTLQLPDTLVPGVANASQLFESDIELTAWDSYGAAALGAIRAGDTVAVRMKSDLPQGMMLKQGARVLTAGSVVLGVMNFNGSDEQTGAITLAATHHLT